MERQPCEMPGPVILEVVAPQNACQAFKDLTCLVEPTLVLEGDDVMVNLHTLIRVSVIKKDVIVVPVIVGGERIGHLVREQMTND
jgi:hypothetical protein